MNPIPSARASAMWRIVTGRPSNQISPASAWWTPPRIFISVDLPAPFSPMSATTSPCPTDRLTSSNASTPGKRLVMFLSSSRDAGMALPAAEFLQLGRERIHAGLVDGQGGHDDLLVGRDHRLVAVEHPVHQMNRLVAELVGLLNDRGEDRALANTGERLVVFIEANNPDLADFAGFLYCVEDGRAVVTPQTHEAGDIGILDDRVERVGFGANGIRVVRAHVDDLHVRILQRFFDTGEAIVGVLRAERADKDHDFAALRQRLLDQLAGLPPRGNIVRAHVAGPPAVRGIAVVGDKQRLSGRLIEEQGLVGRINRTDGNTVHAFGQQVIDNAPLRRRRAVAWNLELQLDVWQFLGRFLATRAGDGPKIRRVVRSEERRV